MVGLLAGGVLSRMTEPLARRPILDQALLTLGVALIVAEPCHHLRRRRAVDPGPAGARRPSASPAARIPTYRLVLIGVGAVLALVVYLVVERTPVGALVRATVADREMVSALGVDNRLVKVAVFAVGSMLATMAGVLGAPVYGARPGLDSTVLILALVVVVIGGLGSVRGALVGALIIGQIDSLGRALLPDLASFILFGALALVLVLRPQGLFGGHGGRR